MYSELQATATRLLKQYDGRSTKVSIVRSTGGAVSASTGAFVDGTETTTEIDCIVSPYSASKRANENIISGDLRVVMTYETAPLNNDKFVIDGNVYGVVGITTVNVGGTVLLYTVQVRR